jgi:cell division protein DivIC
LELLRGKFVAGQKNKIKKSSHNRVFIRIALGMALILAVASAVAIYFEQETQIARMLERKAGLERRLENAQAARDELLELKSIVDTDEYIERIARDQLGMVRSDEIIFEQ